MVIITDPKEMQQTALAAKRAGERIAFVPTMGYLHAGHASLLDEGRKRGDLLVLSIYVNPTQFGPSEDLDRYPRDLERDCAIARAAGVDIVFAPTTSLYPADASTWVNVEGLTEVLCGASRPGHFRGVTTVVNKLFNLVQPDVALFGCKDFQQLAVIRRMVRDLDIPVEIVGMPIVREDDGLALSSRNVYLSPEQRRQALALIGAIREARELAQGGTLESAAILAAVHARIEQQPEARIDYARICHRSSLHDQSIVDGDAILLLAVFVGKTRLIDNAPLLAPESK